MALIAVRSEALSVIFEGHFFFILGSELSATQREQHTDPENFIGVVLFMFHFKSQMVQGSRYAQVVLARNTLAK